MCYGVVGEDYGLRPEPTLSSLAKSLSYKWIPGNIPGAIIQVGIWTSAVMRTMQLLSSEFYYQLLTHGFLFLASHRCKCIKYAFLLQQRAFSLANPCKNWTGTPE